MSKSPKPKTMLFIRKKQKRDHSGSVNTSHFDQDQDYLSTAKMTENQAAYNEYSDGL